MSNVHRSKCIFCQSVLAKCKTVCPVDSKRADMGCGYAPLAAAVDGFRETGCLDCLPSGLKCENWDEAMTLKQRIKDVARAGMRLVDNSCIAQSWNACVSILLPPLPLVKLCHVAGR